MAPKCGNGSKFENISNDPYQHPKPTRPHLWFKRPSSRRGWRLRTQRCLQPLYGDAYELQTGTPPAFQAKSSDESKDSIHKYPKFCFAKLIETRLTRFELFSETANPFTRSEVSKAALSSRAYAGLLVIGAVSPKSHQELSTAG